MRAIILLILLGTTLTAAAFQPPSVLYRYEWVPSGSSHPTSLGSQFSGYIDFTTASGNGADDSLIYDMQWTASNSTTNGGSMIPTHTFTDSDIAYCGNLAWNATQISFLSLNMTNSATPENAVLTDTTVQTGFPEQYNPNEVTQPGQWIYQGMVSVPEPSVLTLLASLAFPLLAFNRWIKSRAKE